jgi:hypothetical protein
MLDVAYDDIATAKLGNLAEPQTAPRGQQYRRPVFRPDGVGNHGQLFRCRWSRVVGPLDLPGTMDAARVSGNHVIGHGRVQDRPQRARKRARPASGRSTDWRTNPAP